MNLDELRQQTSKFMQFEELHDYRNQVQVDNGGDKGKEKDRGVIHAPKRSYGFKESWRPQFHTYTPLNADRIMDEAMNADPIPTLRKIQSSKDTGTSRQCRYHHNFINMTEEC